MNRQDIIDNANSVISEFASCISNVQITESFPLAVELMLQCMNSNGKIVSSGVGKAGIAMEKYSAILRSFGMPSVYLDPCSAQHGDLGILSTNDILFIASTSGKTSEILKLIDLSRNIGVKNIIGITSHLDSPIRDKVDVVIDMGIIKEAGYLSLAPTSSILVMMAICDCLALSCAREKEVTFDDYSKYHHSGYLGQLARSKSSSSSYDKK